ncbi:MAG: hypothetical protein OQJ99_02340, partial [Rhodospirillales bacterium]|nr:hypothetical protein [Rhodospirillales bacterium]
KGMYDITGIRLTREFRCKNQDVRRSEPYGRSGIFPRADMIDLSKASIPYDRIDIVPIVFVGLGNEDLHTVKSLLDGHLPLPLDLRCYQKENKRRARQINSNG